MMLCIHRRLGVVTHHAAATATGGHRAGIQVRKRDLFIRALKPLTFQNLQLCHLFMQLVDLLVQTVYALSLIHISEPTRPVGISRMPSSA